MRRSIHTINGSIRSAYCALLTSLEVEALQPAQRKLVFYVVEDVGVDAALDPFAHVAVKVARQSKEPETAVFRAEMVHALNGFVDYILILGAQLRAAVGEEQLDERVEEFEVAFGWLQRERIDSRPVRPNPVHLAAVKLYLVFVGSANIEDVGKAVVFPL